MAVFKSSKSSLVLNTLRQSGPVYVQYYVTSRCNLRCEQCNVIYANADARELDTDDAYSVIDSLGDIRTSVVLLTGGEPFIRADLPKLAKRAIENGIHPRIQTNGLASEAKLKECADYGVRDISISLDSLAPTLQDKLNGGFEDSWRKAIQTVSLVGRVLGKQTFAAFGCVFSPYNFKHVESVIRFATEIGWWVSLVPAHTTLRSKPRSFSTYDRRMKFSEDQFSEAQEVLDRIKDMKAKGYNVYDSDQYLEDIGNYITNQPTLWRSRNNNVCDAGGLYFAVLPDGSMAPCCDWRMKSRVSLLEPRFSRDYKRGTYQEEITEIAKDCSGCLYGSYPEITISARFLKATLERAKLFMDNNQHEITDLPFEALETIASKFRSQ